MITNFVCLFFPIICNIAYYHSVEKRSKHISVKGCLILINL